MIKFCVGANFRNIELLDHADRCNQRGPAVIGEFYGSVQNPLLPSIGFGSDNEHSTFAELAAFTAKAARYGIRVHTNLNTVTATPDYVEKNKTSLGDYLSRLEDAGVAAAIFTTAPLIEFARQRGTSLKLVLSAIAQADSMQKIRRYRELGANRIILSLFRGRDFTFLDRLKSVPGMEWEILCNEICQSDCPFLGQHYLHRSAPGFASDPTRNYYYRFCHRELRKDFPVNVLKARFIRPEDVAMYHDRCGIEYFKIVRREIHPDLLKYYMDVYTSLRYEGDLLRLFPMFTRTPGQLTRRNKTPIPNARLDGFLSHFIDRRPDCGNDCHDCGGACDHCLRTAHSLRATQPASAGTGRK